MNKDKITFSDMDSITNVFLGKKSCMFAIETCTNRLDIKLEMKENLTNNNDLKGAMIYYERELFIGTIYIYVLRKLHSSAFYRMRETFRKLDLVLLTACFGSAFYRMLSHSIEFTQSIDCVKLHPRH